MAAGGKTLTAVCDICLLVGRTYVGVVCSTCWVKITAVRTLGIADCSAGICRCACLRINMSVITAVRYGEPLVAVWALCAVVRILLRSFCLLRCICAVTICISPGFFLCHMYRINSSAVSVRCSRNLLVTIWTLLCSRSIIRC